MKTKQELFVDACAILCNALPTPNQEKRLSALWEFYQNTDLVLLMKTAKECAASLDRFPTPKQFGEVLQKMRAKEPSVSSEHRVKCERCDGHGMVRIGLEMYRGSCDHGDKFPAFKRAPVDEQAIFAVLRAQEQNHDAFYGSGSWKEQTASLRKMAQQKCLPPATWI